MIRPIIYYGDGNINIKYKFDIMAFDMKITGKYNLETYENSNFIITEKKGRIIGFSMGTPLGEGNFLKYEGNLKISSCKIVGSDLKKYSAIPTLRTYNEFRKIRDNFDGKTDKFEDLTQSYTVGKELTKTSVKWTNKGIHTKGGELTLNGKYYIGDCHIHSDGTIMTGIEHTDKSEILELKGLKERQRRIKRGLGSIKKTKAVGGRSY